MGVVDGRRVVAGPGVACPKSRRAGCEPAALESDALNQDLLERAPGLAIDAIEHLREQPNWGALDGNR